MLYDDEIYRLSLHVHHLCIDVGHAWLLQMLPRFHQTCIEGVELVEQIHQNCSLSLVGVQRYCHVLLQLVEELARGAIPHQ